MTDELFGELQAKTDRYIRNQQPVPVCVGATLVRELKFLRGLVGDLARECEEEAERERQALQPNNVTEGTRTCLTVSNVYTKQAKRLRGMLS